jgi:hypothetical protein
LNSAERPWALLKKPLTLDWSALSPTALLSEPSTLEKRANAPTPVFAPPVVLLKSTAAPTAVCSFEVLDRSVAPPIAVLKLAAPLLRPAYMPNPELYIPVTPARASCPSAVLLTGSGPGSGVSVALWTCWQSPKQTSADRTIVNMISRIFIVNFLSLYFWPFLRYPCRAACSRNGFGGTPHPREKAGTVAPHLWPFAHFFCGAFLSEIPTSCQEKNDKIAKDEIGKLCRTGARLASLLALHGLVLVYVSAQLTHWLSMQYRSANFVSCVPNSFNFLSCKK